MSFVLTRDTLRAAYDLLQETQPFCRWNLPDSDDVVFRVARSHNNFGWHTFDGVQHGIAISAATVGTLDTLLKTMAHEMIHVHEHSTRSCKSNTEHSAAFKRWAAQVSKIHGFDPKSF